jgi:hypothetical protein
LAIDRCQAVHPNAINRFRESRNCRPEMSKAEMAALTRDELIAILTEIVQATRTRLSEARPTDGLKAAEMLAKMCGWNEPERFNVQSVEVKVDAALIEQLRAGYAQLNERSAKACLPLPSGAGVG